MPKNKYWDDGLGQWVQVSPSMEEFDTHLGEKVAIDDFDIHLGKKVTEAHEPIIEGYTESIKTLPLSGNVTFDTSESNVLFCNEPTGDVDFLSGTVLAGAVSLTLIIKQGATARVISFPANVKWANDDLPDLTTANKTYVITLLTINEGADWLGMFGGEF